MGQRVMADPDSPRVFNGAVETGLRSLAILTQAYPATMSLQRLVVLDYLVVHSDDVEDGPRGLHPRTPDRGGQLLVRRETIQSGVLLFMSRGLIGQLFDSTGIRFQATDESGSFLDAFRAEYVMKLRHRAEWVHEAFGTQNDEALERLAAGGVADWGSEFEMSSTLWSVSES